MSLKKRSSSEKRLSANKSRLASPSPKKKRWEDSGDTSSETTQSRGPVPKIASQSDSRKQKISLTSQTTKPPMIPHHPRSPRPMDKTAEDKKAQDIVNNSITSLADEKITKATSFE